MSNIIQKNPLELVFDNSDVMVQFQKVLGKNSEAFMTTVINNYNSTDLKKCDPESVKNCALVSAALNLSVDPNLGLSYIIPYGNKAQFQIGYKGLIELGHRSGAFLNMNVTNVKEGEYLGVDRMKGLMDFRWYQDNDKRNELKTIGYLAYIELHGGFSKQLYMTDLECITHGKRYSKAYNNPKSQWQNGDASEMKLKTVLKLLLTKWAPKSANLLNMAIAEDQKIYDANGNGNYDDNPSQAIDLETHNKEVARNQQLHFIETQTDINLLQTVENHIEDEDIMVKYKQKMDQLLKQQSNG